MADELCLEFLGGLRVRRGTAPITGFVSNKALALLCYLAVTARPHFRAALAARFWSQLPEADARMNLRRVLANLRTLVGEHLVITRDSVAFNAERPYSLDVAQFEAHLQRADAGEAEHLSAATACYRGDFLEGFALRDAPDFDEWMITEGERLRQLAFNALHELATHYARRGNYSAGIDYASRLLKLDPWREDAHRQLMLLLAESGQTSAALQQYELCRRVLRDDLGVEPFEATTLLYEQIRAGAIVPRLPALPDDNPLRFTAMLAGRDADQALVARLLEQRPAKQHRPCVQLASVQAIGARTRRRMLCG